MHIYTLTHTHSGRGLSVSGLSCFLSRLPRVCELAPRGSCPSFRGHHGPSRLQHLLHPGRGPHSPSVDGPGPHRRGCRFLYPGRWPVPPNLGQRVSRRAGGVLWAAGERRPHPAPEGGREAMHGVLRPLRALPHPQGNQGPGPRAHWPRATQPGHRGAVLWAWPAFSRARLGARVEGSPPSPCTAGLCIR